MYHLQCLQKTTQDCQSALQYKGQQRDHQIKNALNQMTTTLNNFCKQRQWTMDFLLQKMNVPQIHAQYVVALSAGQISVNQMNSQTCEKVLGGCVQKFDVLMNTCFAPLIADMDQSLKPSAQQAQRSIISGVLKIVGELAGSLVAPLEGLAGSLVAPLGGLAGSLVAPVGGLAGSLVAPVGGLAGSLVAPVGGLAGSLVAPVGGLAGSFLAPVGGLAGSLLAPLGELTGSLVAPLRGLTGPGKGGSKKPGVGGALLGGVGLGR
ncbi:uncharacterized protein [Ambystoma mexicanum]|uniref:uncharacterized protein n=1 Tax=Ambystoma mexicanum TaxID=8296 RepID=UPI0037E8BED2